MHLFVVVDLGYPVGSYMSQTRRLRRGLRGDKIKTALMMKRLITEAGSMDALKADFQTILERTFIQKEKETYAPAIATA